MDPGYAVSLWRDVFCDDDQEGKPGQVNPVKLVGWPAVVGVAAAVVAAAWHDAFAGTLGDHVVAYFLGLGTGLAGFAAAVWGHSCARR